MDLHYHHIMLTFCEMNSVFECIFRVLLYGKYFFGFSVRGKVFFWVVQKYPTLLSIGLSSSPPGPIIKLIAVWETVNVSH